MLAVRPTNVHRLAVADVLVRERTGGRQADNVAQDHTRDAALGRGRDAAVVDLARRGDVAGKGRRRDVGLALGHAVAQRVVVGVRTAQHVGHGFAVSHVLVAEAAADSQEVARQQVQAVHARDRSQRRAVVHLVQCAESARQLTGRNVGGRGGVEGDRVVAGIGACQHAIDVDLLARARILVCERARRRQAYRVAGDLAGKCSVRVGRQGAVIGLASGRDRAGQRLGRDGGRRGAVIRHRVVACIGALQQTGHRHGFAHARILVGEQARACQRDGVALNGARQLARCPWA
ncbi:hypothetical protein G6F35_012928 [Rhizopus arrhizus]|nr:hypothetical protein G6F35_012928 [Rhizopus arrhizus]